MKRKLLRQIANEWRINIWLAIELLLVSAVMWWLTDQLWVKYSIYNEPLGYDYSHCYRIHVSTLNEKSPDFDPNVDYEAEIADMQTMIQRLEARPEIEAVGIGTNSHFFNQNNSNQNIHIDSLGGFYLKRWVTPGFMKVFRIHGANGESPEEMAALLEKMPWNSFMATDNLFRDEEGIPTMKPYIGKIFHSGADSIEWTLTAAMTPLRYSDFSQTYKSSSVLMPLTPATFPYANETVVRVKENMDKDFIANIMSDALGNLRVGNFYIASVESFDDIRDGYNLNQKQKMQQTVVWSLFLLLNIFLGVLGTFWFRTSQRTPEIALRMANGATRGDIMRRILAEGLLILIAVTPISAAICLFMAHSEFNSSYMGLYLEPVRFVGCTLITFGLVALMILIGSWLPARKAMSISPAEALKTE